MLLQIHDLLYMAGEWLLCVTDLQSHPELCGSDDDSSYCFSRSKEDTCSAVEPFVGVSNPNAPLTHMSLWYTTPHQFLLELLFSVFLVLPLIVFGMRKIRTLLRKTTLEPQRYRFWHKVRIQIYIYAILAANPFRRANTAVISHSLLELVLYSF